jgi:hypothetical protein
VKNLSDLLLSRAMVLYNFEGSKGQDEIKTWQDRMVARPRILSIISNSSIWFIFRPTKTKTWNI